MINLESLKGHLLSFFGILTLCPDSLCLIYLSNAIPHGTLLALRYTLNCIMSTLLYVVVCDVEAVPMNMGFVTNGLRGVQAGVCFAIVHVCVTYAFIVENAATVLIILSSSPIWAAISSYVFLSEVQPLRTILCGLVCLSCVTYVFLDKMLNRGVEENICVGHRDGLSGCRDCCNEHFSNAKQYDKCADLCMNDGDVEKSGSVLGLFAAILASISFGVYFMLLRMIFKDEENKDIDEDPYAEIEFVYELSDRVRRDSFEEAAKDNKIMRRLLLALPCDILASLLAAMIGVCLIRDELTMEWNIGLVLFVNSAIILPVSFTLLTLSSGFIPAPEVSLYCLIETVIGPFLVWLGGYEKPSKADIIGGSVLLTSLAINSIVGIREYSSPLSAELKTKTENVGMGRDDDSVEGAAHSQSRIG